MKKARSGLVIAAVAVMFAVSCAKKEAAIATTEGGLDRTVLPIHEPASTPTKEFDAQMGNGDEFVRRSFESLWAYLSPDA